LVKLDEDVYVRAKRFIKVIRNLPLFEPIYGGYYYDQKKRVMPVSRDKNDKFSFTPEELPDKNFNPYVGGPIYFMSNSVAIRLPYKIVRFSRGEDIEEVPDTYLGVRPAIYRLEDVYMGYLIAKMKPEVTFWHVPKFILDFDHVRGGAQVALHNVRDPEFMLHAKELLG
jgi:hypothetical protein